MIAESFSRQSMRGTGTSVFASACMIPYWSPRSYSEIRESGGLDPAPGSVLAAVLAPETA
jgi:hypothetical protein